MLLLCHTSSDARKVRSSPPHTYSQGWQLRTCLALLAWLHLSQSTITDKGRDRQRLIERGRARQSDRDRESVTEQEVKQHTKGASKTENDSEGFSQRVGRKMLSYQKTWRERESEIVMPAFVVFTK